MGTKPAPEPLRDLKGDTYRWFTMSRVIPFLDRPLDRFMAEVDRLLKREV